MHQRHKLYNIHYIYVSGCTCTCNINIFFLKCAYNVNVTWFKIADIRTFLSHLTTSILSYEATYRPTCIFCAWFYFQDNLCGPIVWEGNRLENIRHWGIFYYILKQIIYTISYRRPTCKICATFKRLPGLWARELRVCRLRDLTMALTLNLDHSSGKT